MREKTFMDVYNNFSKDGEYKITEINKEMIQKIRDAAIDNADYIDFLLKQNKINWRVIYVLYYDVLRELSQALILTRGIKVSNHQACFAYICKNFSKLELDWNFFEKIRTTRNKNKYEGKEILKQNWKDIEVQIKIYASTIKKEIDKRLKP